MKYELIDAIVEVDTRKAQLTLIWGSLIGFFKKLPVIVYEGDVLLDDTNGKIKEHYNGNH